MSLCVSYSSRLCVKVWEQQIPLRSKFALGQYSIENKVNFGPLGLGNDRLGFRWFCSYLWFILFRVILPHIYPLLQCPAHSQGTYHNNLKTFSLKGYNYFFNITTFSHFSQFFFFGKGDKGPYNFSAHLLPTLPPK